MKKIFFIITLVFNIITIQAQDYDSGIDASKLDKSSCTYLMYKVDCYSKTPFDFYEKDNNIFFYYSFHHDGYGEGTYHNRINFDLIKEIAKKKLMDTGGESWTVEGRKLKLYVIKNTSKLNGENYLIKQICFNPLLYITTKVISNNYQDARNIKLYQIEKLDDLLKIMNSETKEEVVNYIINDKLIQSLKLCLESSIIRSKIEEEKNNLAFNKLRINAVIYYANEISSELKKSPLFAAKDEFETKQDYELRMQKAESFKKEVENKYTEIYKENTEKQENLRLEKIKASYSQVNLTIIQLGAYNAEKETFPITLEGITPLELKIPRQDAKSFKENIAKVIIKADKQLKDDAKTFWYFNIEITHPITGSKYVLQSGNPLYLDYVSKDISLIGVPKLVSTVKFIEPSGNNLLDGNETAKFEVKIENLGDGIAQNVNINLSAIAPNGITFEKTKSFTGITPNQSQTATFEVKADRNITNKEIPFTFDFTEARGFKPGSINYTINSQAFKAPHLVLKDVGIKEVSGNGNNIIENGENIEVSVLIQNSGQGLAQDALTTVSISDPNIIALTPTKMRQSINDLQPGDSRIITFNFSVNYDYKGAVLLPITLVLSEKYKEYGGNFPLNLDMKKVSLATANIKVEGQYAKDLTIKDISFTSDVDKNIPETIVKNSSRYALVIGNENYSKFQNGLNIESNVDFANNDASVFAQYCQKTLGIPEENITLLLDANSPQMNSAIEKLCKLAQYSNGQAELIFYYAGHGFPDEVSKEAYIMPVDISGTNVKYGIKLNDLYTKLTINPSKRISIFLDACFSGGGRNQGLLAARGVRVTPKTTPIQGNLIVITASSSDQSSLPYKEKQHGMFTYFLLKKLQDCKDNISYKSLTDYIINEVQLNAVKVNNKEQNPQVLISPSIDQIWTNWLIK